MCMATTSAMAAIFLLVSRLAMRTVSALEDAAGAGGVFRDGGVLPPLPWSYYDDLLASLPPAAGGDGDSDDGHGDGPEGGGGDGTVASVKAVDPRTNRTESYDLRRIVAFLPLDVYGSSDLGTMDVPAAVLLAIRHFNEGIGDVVPEIADNNRNCRIKLATNLFNTKQSPIVAASQFDELLHFAQPHLPDQAAANAEHMARHESSVRRPTAVLGASRSAVSSPLAILSGIHGVPQVSYASTSTVFNNKDQYPLFGRLIPSAIGDAGAAVSYLTSKLGVTHIGVLFVRDEYGSAYAQALQDAARSSSSSSSSAGDDGPTSPSAPSLKIGVLSSFAFDACRSEISAAVRRLADSGLRYFFGVIFRVHSRTVLAEAHAQGVAGPGYHWIFGDGMSDMTFRAGEEDGLIEAAGGSALLTIALPSTRKGRPEYEAFLTHWSDLAASRAAEGRKYLESKMPPLEKNLGEEGGGDGGDPSQRADLTDAYYSLSEEPGPFELLAYDSVIAMGMAACGAAEEEGRNFDGSAFYRSFLRTTFDGLYGTVVINPKTGSRLYSSVPYSISNFVAGPPDKNSMVTMHLHPTDVQEQGTRPTWDSTVAGTGNLGGVEEEVVWWRSIERFIYSDGSTDPPPVLPALVQTVHTVEIGGTAFGIVLSCIAIVLCFGFGLWTFLNRDNVVVKSSQPIFLLMLCLGAFLISLGIIPMSTQREINQGSLGGEAACMLMPWLFSMGFVVAFSGLFSKTMLVNKIRRSQGFRRRVAVKLRDVLQPFAFLFFANVAILTSWTIVSPLTYILVEMGSVDEFGRPDKFYVKCGASNTSSSASAFPILWGVNNLSALVFANIQAYKGRYIMTEYSESFYISISMATLLQSVIIGTPVLLGVGDSPTARLVVMCCLEFITAMALLLPIFVPKIVFLRRWRAHEKKMERKLILTLKKERQMDALAIGDISAGSWYLQRMDGSRQESGTNCEGDMVLRSIVSRASAGARQGEQEQKRQGTENEQPMHTPRRSLSDHRVVPHLS